MTSVVTSGATSGVTSGARWGLALAVVIGVVALGARRGRAGDEGARLFGLVDLSLATQRAPEPLKVEIARLASGRGLTAIADPGVRRALSGSEPAAVTVARIVGEAGARQDGGDCAAAAALAREAETVSLTALTVDEEREPLKRVYTILLACEHQLGHAELARAAAVRLRTLVSLPPSALPQTLWDSYVPAALPAGPKTTTTMPAAAPMVELVVDSDPPNARVAVNFHQDGVTPHTLKVAPGVVYIEVEKAGFKKAFQKITVDKTAARVVFPLADRRQDRAAQVESAVARLRGSDPMSHPTTLARLAELARVDVLVAIMVNAGTVKLWWFDADRGDLITAPMETRFDPKTGRMLSAAAAPPTNQPATN